MPFGHIEKPNMSDTGDETLATMWDRLNDPCRYGPAVSTIKTLKYVLRQNDPERLRAWLAMRSGKEQVTFKKMLVVK
jgi:hypothetical protein